MTVQTARTGHRFPRVTGLRPAAGYTLVFIAALAARLGVIYARSGSVFDGAGYDPSVYYAAADALAHGRLPYRDFTLLHPPLLPLILTPIAVIGRLTTDRAGFEIASGLSILVGSWNAVLVTAIARRMGAGRSAALVGGLLYALTVLSARDEISPRLEDFGNFFVLLALWCYVVSARSPSRRVAILTGVALAAAASVKLWYALPLVLVLIWHWVDRRPWRSLCWAAAGAAAIGVIVNGPFLILAGRPMVRMLVTDQVGRARTLRTLTRASDLDLLSRVRPHSSTRVELACAIVALVLLAGGVVLACRTPLGRLPAALLVAELLVLFASPAYFASYADYVMPAASLCVAAAVGRRTRTARVTSRRSLPWVGWLLVAGAALVAARIDLVNPPHILQQSPDRYLQRAAAGFECVQSDSPEPLIALNVLSRDLAHGCPQWVDVSGRTYDASRSPNNLPRRRNQRWQRDLLRYLRAGQAYVLVDVKREGLSRRTLAQLTAAPPIARGDGLVLRVNHHIAP